MANSSVYVRINESIEAKHPKLKYIYVMVFVVFYVIGSVCVILSTYPNYNTNISQTCQSGFIVKNITSNETYCECYHYYLKSFDSMKCDYKQSSSLSALFIQMFYGFVGAGYFYIKMGNFGLVMCVLFLLSSISVLVLNKKFFDESGDMTLFIYHFLRVFKMASTTAFLTAWIISIISFWMKYYKVDGDGYELAQ